MKCVRASAVVMCGVRSRERPCVETGTQKQACGCGVCRGGYIGVDGTAIRPCLAGFKAGSRWTGPTHWRRR